MKKITRNRFKPRNTPSCKNLQLKRSERGQPIGESASNAKFSDHEVELMRALHEEYPPGHDKYVNSTVLAEKFGCHRMTAWRICNYMTYATTVASIS